MSVKLTTQEIKSRLKRINPLIRVLGKYVNATEPLKCRCRHCQHCWSPKWADLSQGHGCPQCAGSIKLTEADLVRGVHIKNPSTSLRRVGEHFWLKCKRCSSEWQNTREQLKHNLGTCQKCLATRLRRWITTEEARDHLCKIGSSIRIASIQTNINSNTKLKCQCCKCGNKFLVKWSSLKRGGCCPKCKMDGFRHTLAEIKHKLRTIQPNTRVLSTVYTNTMSLLNCKCRVCEHEWKAPWSRLNQGHGCPRCGNQAHADAQRFSLTQIKQRLKKASKPIEIVSKQYENNKTPLKCKCLKCHRYWVTTWARLSQDHGCPHCGGNLQSEEKVREIFESVTGLKWPRANPTDASWLRGLTLDGYCRELITVKFPNGTAFERQGQQHTKLCLFNDFDPEKLRQQKRRDWRKRYQCWYHGVRLITIPYWVKDIEAYIRKRLAG